MELDEILNGLYSQNKNEILSIINTAHHPFDESYPKEARFLHTGFYCKTHKETVIEFIFCIDNKELYFQNGNSVIFCPLGLCMLPSGCVDYNSRIVIQYSLNYLSQYHCIYCNVYDMDKNNIYSIVTDSITKNINSHYEIKIGELKLNQFFITSNGDVKKFHLYTPEIHRFYRSGEGKFRIM